MSDPWNDQAMAEQQESDRVQAEQELHDHDDRAGYADLDRLYEIAEAATPGPWTYHTRGGSRNLPRGIVTKF